MAKNNAVQITEERKPIALKDPEQQLRDFAIYLKQHDLQAKQSTEIAAIKCPVQHKSGIKDEYGQTPLIKAIEEGDTATAEQYIRNCSDITENGKYEDSPLHIAAYKNNADITLLLLEHGADVNAKSNYGKTVLHGAGSAEVAEILLKHSADVNAKNKLGLTPLHYTGSAEVAETLLQHGADVNAKTNYGSTPLHTVRSAEIAEILLQHGAEVNAENNFGWTPLRDVRSTEVAEILLKRGAEVSAEDKWNVCDQLKIDHPICQQGAHLTGENHFQDEL